MGTLYSIIDLLFNIIRGFGVPYHIAIAGCTVVIKQFKPVRCPDFNGALFRIGGLRYAAHVFSRVIECDLIVLYGVGKTTAARLVGRYTGSIGIKLFIINRIDGGVG